MKIFVYCLCFILLCAAIILGPYFFMLNLPFTAVLATCVNHKVAPNRPWHAIYYSLAMAVIVGLISGVVLRADVEQQQAIATYLTKYFIIVLSIDPSGCCSVGVALDVLNGSDPPPFGRLTREDAIKSTVIMPFLNGYVSIIAFAASIFASRPENRIVKRMYNDEKKIYSIISVLLFIFIAYFLLYVYVLSARFQEPLYLGLGRNRLPQEILVFIWPAVLALIIYTFFQFVAVLGFIIRDNLRTKHRGHWGRDQAP